MMGRVMRRGWWVLLFIVGAPGVASAFLPTARPWPVTPERFLRTTSEPEVRVDHRPLARLGLRPWSFRPDGRVAWAFNPSPLEPRSMTPATAAELALVAGRSLAKSLGIAPEDLDLVGTNHFEGWITVTLRQSKSGLPVHRGFVVFTYRDGQLAAFRNELYVPIGAPEVPVVDAEAAAARAEAVAKEVGPDAKVVEPPSLIWWAPGDDPEELKVAWKVRVSARRPRLELSVFLDAGSGTLLAADDELRHADGEGRIRMAVDAQTATDPQQVPFRVPSLELSALTTDADGEVLATGTHELSYRSEVAEISDQSGQPLETFTVQFQGPFRTYDLVPQRLSQADPFVHVHVVKDFARQITPNLPWLDQRLLVNVNLPDVCNAYWDGQTINFYQAGGGCNNTGRIASVVYHEFGHGYHQQLTNNLVGSVGEGTGDFLAATLAGDPVIGRGISTNGGGLRRIDEDRRYPDHYVNEVHEDGLIWASPLWNLREALIQKHGDWSGRRQVERAFVKALTQGPGLSTAYPSILFGDDDDNDISNGTPNSCEINAAFRGAGLISAGQINHQEVPGRAFVRIRHAAPGRFVPAANGGIIVEANTENRSSCGSYDAAALELHFAPGLSGGTFTRVPMTVGPNGSSGELSGLTVGDTFRYYFRLSTGGVTYSEGDESSPHLGWIAESAGRELLSEGFEAGLGNFTHGTVGSDLVDDWEAGVPRGAYFDPFEAWRGGQVAGTDLASGGTGGRNGGAKPGRTTFLDAPALTSTGVEHLRLEFWHHHAIDGTLRILIDGQELWRYAGTGTQWSRGWRYLSLPLPAEFADRSAPFVIRFEASPSPTNPLGGWALDEVKVVGSEIPPPPPPPPPPPVDPPADPPPTDPPLVGVDPPADSGTPGAPASAAAEATGLKRQGISGGCRCVSRPGSAPLSNLGAALLLVGAGLGLRKKRPRRG